MSLERGTADLTPAALNAARARAARRGVPLVAAATFCFWTSLYLYVPVLPLHAEELGASLTMVGTVVAAYAIGQVALRIPVGVAADLLGRRKPFAIASLLASALGALWLALSPDPWSLFGARTVTGVAAAGWVAISVLFASYFPPGRTTKAMATVMTVNGIGLVLATMVGGLMADWLGTESTFWAAAAVGLLGIAILATAPEPPLGERPRYSVQTILRVARSPLLLQIGAIGIMAHFVTFGTTFGFLPVYAESLGASKSQVGYITTAVLTGSVLGTMSSALLVHRLGYRGTMLLSSAVTLAAMVMVPFISELLPLGAIQAFNGWARGMMLTVLMGLTLRAAPPAERATAMGIFQATYAIGMLSGPAVSGRVADGLGLDAVFYLCAGVTAIGAALIFVRRLPDR